MGTGSRGGGPQGPPPEIQQAINQAHHEHDQALGGLKQAHHDHVHAAGASPHHVVAEAANKYERALGKLRRAHTTAVDKAYQGRPSNV